MGYSGLGIINGDYPMDMISEIMDMIGAKSGEGLHEYKVRKGSKPIADRLTEKQDELLAHCKKDGSTAWKKKHGEQYIATLVLGAVMMRNGASINPKTMKALMNACDKDPWGKNELERRLYLEDFKDILSTYDHKTPTKEWKDHYAMFNIKGDEYIRGRFSSKVALMARYYLTKFYGDKEWCAGINLLFSKDGYALLIGVKFNEERTPEKAVDALQGLFEIPLFITDVDAFKLQEFDEDVMTVPNSQNV